MKLFPPFETNELNDPFAVMMLMTSVQEPIRTKRSQL